MKTIKTIITVVALLSTVISYANGNEGTSVNTDIQKELYTGNSFGIKRSEKVNVIFTTDFSGKVDLVIVNTDDAELKKAIEEKFSRMQFKGLKTDVAYGITLDFRLM